MTARDIAIALGGQRAQKVAGGGWLVPCPVPNHGKGRGDRSPSLRIGDGASHLLVHCYAGCDHRDVLAELRRRGLLDDDKPGRPRERKPVERVPMTNDHAREQHRKAAWLWSQRKPITGSIAEKYLREARGITCQLQTTLAFLPPKKPEHFPALISAFALPDEIEPSVLGEPRGVAAVHLTLLKPDGSGKADMPDDKNAKIIVGSCSLPIVVSLIGLRFARRAQSNRNESDRLPGELR